MKNSKITPGPWKWARLSDASLAHCVYVGEPLRRGEHATSFNSVACLEFEAKEQNEANARLIASAPDLLNCIQFILANVKDVTGEGHLHLTGQMQAMLQEVLTKATGGK